MYNLASSILPLKFVLKLKNSERGNFGIVVEVCIICNYRFGILAMLAFKYFCNAFAGHENT